MNVDPRLNAAIRRLRASARSDEAVSEVIGMLLMTGMTVALVAVFGIAILTAAGGDELAPSGAFSLTAVVGADHVNVSFASGGAFDDRAATFVLLVNDTVSRASHDVVVRSASTRFSPGDVLRVNLTPSAPTLGAGSRIEFFAFDTSTGKLIGTASTRLNARAVIDSFTAFGNPSLAQPSMTPPILIADGASLGTLRVRATHEMGRSLLASVTVDLASLGGESAIPLKDDGVRGDALAEDGEFTLQFVVPANVTARDVQFVITARDVFGNAATRTLDARVETGVRVSQGAQWRNVPSSEMVGGLNLSRFVFHSDAVRTNDDLIWIRITDEGNATRWWDAEVRLDARSCALDPSVIEVVLSSWNTAGPTTHTPVTGCVSAGGRSTNITISRPEGSTDGAGGATSWIQTGDASGNYYADANISAANVAAVIHFGDDSSSAATSRGILLAHLDWTLGASALPPPPPPPPTNPTAAFTFTRAGLTIAVNGSTSVDGGSPPLTYSWDWGDGTAAGTGVTATHTYATANTYTVKLTVTNAATGTDFTTQSATVTGSTWFSCPPLAQVAGTLTPCAALQSDADAGATATASETKTGSKWFFDATLAASGFAETGKTHTLSIRAATGLETETLYVQVKVSGTWVTATTFTTATMTTKTVVLTDVQWQSGAPEVRLVDATTLLGTADAKASTWLIDWVKVVTS